MQREGLWTPSRVRRGESIRKDALIEAGADPKAKNGAGESAAALAAKNPLVKGTSALERLK
ncbi:MAG TPA: hypothetical protein DIC53_03555 [Synergistaceae bacterium]|jgi:hypothetical protein|nr:hypothetical protein [Synergistaceae bacterium]